MIQQKMFNVDRSKRQKRKEQGNQRWQTAPPGGLGHGNVHVKFHDDRLRNGGDITY